MLAGVLASEHAVGHRKEPARAMITPANMM
jgi:hypothetical protein